MLQITIKKCESCDKEYMLINDYGSHCIKCGSNNTKVINTINTQYSLYNHKTGYLVD